MRSRLLPFMAAMAIVAPSVLVAGTPTSKKHGSGPIKSAKEAKAIAEQDTGGQALSARRIPLNGASGGWEVEVRMPHEDRGWRCIIDADTRMVHSKTRMDQPGTKSHAEGPVRRVKGTR